MAEIYINPDRAVQEADRFFDYGRDKRLQLDEIRSVRNAITMDDASVLMGIVKQLIRIESDVMDEAVKADNLGKALKYITGHYLKTEKYLTGYLKDLGIKRVFRAIEKINMDILKALGLDELYYRHKMGYEYSNVDKYQEQMVDHYMSEMCQSLMDKDEYSEETWNKATPEERKAMLTRFMREVNAIMGTDVNPDITFTDLGSGTRGQYTWGTNSVTLNSRYLKGGGDTYMIFRTLIHEMRHCYQHTAVDNPGKFMVSEETLRQWGENFKSGNYKTVQKDGYDAYVTQPIEWDAKNFAGQKQDVAGYDPEYRGSW